MDTAILQCFLPNYELIFLCLSLLFSVLCLDPIHTGRTGETRRLYINTGPGNQGPMIQELQA